MLSEARNRSLRILMVALAILSLAACGTTDQTEPDADATSDGGADGSQDVDTSDDVDPDDDTEPDAEPDVDPDAEPDVDPDVVPDIDADPDADTDAGTTCGPRPEVACRTAGCPEGQECAWDAEACYASVCSCIEETGLWECYSDDCNPGWSCLPETGCEGPNPTLTCMVTGCDTGERCVPVEGCTPSSCFCEDGVWICTEDCLQSYACEPIDDDCPAEPPIGGACDDTELRCEWGNECCCGDCHPSTVCFCAEGGWACMATDACFIESCRDRACDRDTDCFGGRFGDGDIDCIDGVCVVTDDGRRCGDLGSQDTCEGLSSLHCEWLVPSACPNTGATQLPHAGCYPHGACETSGDCPDGHECRLEVDILPRCAWDGDDDVSCDACNEQRGVCMPTP